MGLSSVGSARPYMLSVGVGGKRSQSTVTPAAGAGNVRKASPLALLESQQARVRQMSQDV